MICLADLAQLEQVAAGYRSREHFLTELTLDLSDATSDQAGVPLLDDDYLILPPAKGQEWRSAFILNAIHGCMPSDLGTGNDAEIEEERASPRRDDASQGTRCTSCCPSASSRTRSVHRATGMCWRGGRGSSPRRSWITLTTSAGPAPRWGAGTAGARTGLRVDVAAQMRGMWR